jgi:PAS domain S-box-containing protein
MVAHTYEVIGSTQSVIANLRDAETNQRGYVLTGDATYREGYADAARRVDAAHDRLERLVADNPAQTRRTPALRAASRDKLAFAERTIATYDRGGLASATALVGTNQGLTLMRRAEGLAARFAAEERRLLALRSDALSEAERAAVTRVAVAGVLAVLSALFGGFLLLRRGQRTETALASTEAQLAERLAQLEAIYANTPVGLAFVDRDLRYATINQRLAEINGRPVEAHLGRTVREALPEVAEAVEPVLRSVVETRRAVTDVEVATPIGPTPEMRYFLASYWPVVDGGGELSGINLSVIEVTERHRAQTALADAAERYRAIVDTAVDAIAVIDDRGVIQSFNKAAERIFGYGADEAVGRNVSLLMNDDHAAGHDGYLSNYHRSGEARIIGIGRGVEGRRKDGTSFPLDLSIGEWRSADGRRFYTGMMRDVTERKRAQDALAAREALLRLGAEVAGFGTYQWTLGSDHHEWSDQTYAIFGVPHGTRLTIDLVTGIVHPDDRDRLGSEFDANIGTRDVVANEYRIVRPSDGAVRWITNRARVTREDGRPVLVTGAVQDITERRSAEEEIRALNATLEQRVEERTRALEEVNAELNAFAYSVSHDLRAPLRAMEGFARILLDDYAPSLDDDAQRYAKRIVDAAGRMEALINDLLAYSRMSRAELRLNAMDLGRIVGRAVEEVRENAPGAAEVRWMVAADHPNVIGEPAALMQVLINLLSNAVKFSALDRVPEVTVTAEKRGGYVRLTIADNGIGIAPEHRERIFRVFERLHGQESYPGTGIGLAIVRKAMERMNGRCGVESTLGAGSRFWIELPAG